MKTLFNRQYDALLRVRAFAEKHSDLFPPATLAGKMFAVIAAAIPDVTKYAGSQEAGFALAREGLSSKAEARQNLRDCLEAIVKTARSIGRDQPAVLGKFLMPRGGGDRSLINAAIGFVENAGAMKDVFVAHEMYPDFVQELQEAIYRFETAIREHQDRKGLHISATGFIEDTMEPAMDAVYRLAGIVPNKLKKNAAILREWEHARRVASGRVSKSPETEDPPSVGAAPPKP